MAKGKFQPFPPAKGDGDKDDKGSKKGAKKDKGWPPKKGKK